MPRGELRRRDRQMEPPEAEGFLQEATVGRMGTVDRDGFPYVVPLNYAYEAASRTIFIHCATSGHLLDNLAYSPLACFEVDEATEIIATGPGACDVSQVYASVICFGRAGVLNEPADRERALRLLVHKYVDQRMPERRYDPELKTASTTTVIAMKVDRMTGKRRQPV